jgi:hypothetical protein
VLTTLQRRLDQLERKIISPQAMPVADLSGFTDSELEVLEKLLDDTIAAEERRPTGRRPLPLRFDRSILTPAEVLIFEGMIQRGATCPAYVGPE